MRWKRSPRGRTLLASGSEAELAAAVAATELRLELLHDAVGYGVYSVLSEDRDGLLDAWLAWLHWVESLLKDAQAEAGPMTDGVETPAWLEQAIYALEHPDESDAGDRFDVQDVRDWARAQFECLAVRARPIELVAGEPLGEIEDFPSREGKRLLAAVQDSLVLASVDDAEVRSQRAGPAELLDDLLAARDEGVWDVVLHPSKRKAKRVTNAKRATVTNEQIATRGGEIVELLVPAVGNAARVYGELSPDGRELTGSDATTARQQLLAITACLRSIRSDIDVIEAFAAAGRRVGRDGDLRPTISAMRMMQRGFGLALSEDSDRRAAAMPIEELGRFLVPVHRFLASL